MGVNLILNDDSSYNRLEKFSKIDEAGVPYFFILDKNGTILGSNVGPDQGTLSLYVLIEAREGIDPKTAIYKLMRLSKEMKKTDNAETKEFVSFLEKFAPKH